jgi:predicted TIM-barrel enzyme
MGVTTGGAIGATSRQVAGAAASARSTPSPTAARSVREDVIVLCHGGPIAMPDDARFILERTQGCHGFYGASSMERLPVEAAIRDQTASGEFKALPIRIHADASTIPRRDTHEREQMFRLPEATSTPSASTGAGWH